MPHEDQVEQTATRLTDHLIEAAVMRADIEHLKVNQSSTNSQVLQAIGGLAADLKAIRGDIASVPSQINACRIDMRHEIERDFPNKAETLRMEKRIEDQIEATDRTLSKQIQEVSTDLGTKINAVSGEVKTLRTDLDKQWLKITFAVVGVIAAAGTIMWLLDFFNGMVK